MKIIFKIKTLCFVLLFTTSFEVFSQNGIWNNLTTLPPIDFGDGYTEIHCIPGSNILLVGSYKSGIYRSADNGITWNKTLSLNDISVVKITSNGLDKVVAISAYEVYISNDKGVSWITRSAGNIYAFNDLEIINGNDIFISSGEVYEVQQNLYEYRGDGILKSSDDGQNWLSLNLGLPLSKSVMNITFDSQDRLFCSVSSYDGIGSGLYYSDNLGANWQYLNNLKFIVNDTLSITTVYEIKCMEIDRNDSIYFSFDGISDNFHVSGGVKNSTVSLIVGAPSFTENFYSASLPWDIQPFYTIYFANNYGHVYGSIPTEGSNVHAGAYIKQDHNGYQRQVAGITLFEGVYSPFRFTEDLNGRIFTLQVFDNKIYFTDLSANVPTNINHLSASDKPYVIYPNPASDQVFIESDLDLVEVSVFNIYGAMVKSINMDQNDLNHKIDLSDLSSGIYIIRMNEGSRYFDEKIIVTNE